MAPRDWRFAIEWRYGGTDERMLNVGYVRNDDGLATQAQVADAIATAADNELAPAVSSDIDCMGASVSGVTTQDAELFSSGIGETPGGQTGGSGMPRNCCQLVTLNTGLAGKRGRGRIYLPPSNNNDFEIGTSTWTSTQVAVFETAVQSFWDALEAGDPSLIWGKYVAPNLTTFTSYDRTRFVGRRRIGTQRRRVNGRGG